MDRHFLHLCVVLGKKTKKHDLLRDLTAGISKPAQMSLEEDSVGGKERVVDRRIIQRDRVRRIRWSDKSSDIDRCCLIFERKQKSWRRSEMKQEDVQKRSSSAALNLLFTFLRRTSTTSRPINSPRA